jgi:signal transduction histidine kinase
VARIRVAEELLRERIDRKDLAGLYAHLDDIREDVEAMDLLIGRILTMSKLDIHDAALKPEALNPADMVRELLDRLRPVMDQKGLRLEARLNSGAPFFSDREAMVTVLTNLLDNACKYTPENGAVTVTMASEEDGLHMTVTNTSRHLSPEQIGRVFDPFYQVEGSPSRGVGLGLAITRKIIHKQGGTITASQSGDALSIGFILPSLRLPPSSSAG